MIMAEMVKAAWDAWEGCDVEREDPMPAALEAGCGPCIEDIAAALRPFAESLYATVEPPHGYAPDEYFICENIRLSDLRHARAALARWGLEK